MDHAKVRRNIWADEDFRDLPAMSQWLYLYVITSPTLSYCGVADWRPARIAATTSDLSAIDVEVAAVELEMGHYLVIDRDTEEVLVRSWVKHDELMDRWNMAAAMTRTYAQVASKVLRGVIVHELIRLKKDRPDLKGWPRGDVVKVMKKPSIAPEDALSEVRPNDALCPKERPKDQPSDRPNDQATDRGGERGKDRPPPTTSTSTTTNSPPKKSPSKVTSPASRVAKARADESRLAEVRERADREAS
jgi:hypothetical protein